MMERSFTASARHYITKHGRPCLKVSPAEGRESVADAIERIRAFQVKGRVPLATRDPLLVPAAKKSGVPLIL